MYVWLMMVLLVASACATDAVFDEPEVVWPTKLDNWTLVDQFPCLKQVKGKRTTVHAGFAQTKAAMEMNDENNFAKLVWQAGDRFLMLGLHRNTVLFRLLQTYKIKRISEKIYPFLSGTFHYLCLHNHLDV